VPAPTHVTAIYIFSIALAYIQTYGKLPQPGYIEGNEYKLAAQRIP
jgi:hypothetical protein